MMIIGCDYHPGFQQIAFVDTETGELQERRLEHREEAEKFYSDLGAQGIKVRVGMEASGHARWFERLAGGHLPPQLNITRVVFVDREVNGGAPLLALFEKWPSRHRAP